MRIGQQIKNVAFQVIRVGYQPCCVVYNPRDCLTIGGSFTVPVSNQLFVGPSLSSSGPIISTGSFTLNATAGSPPGVELVLAANVWSFPEKEGKIPRYRAKLISDFDNFVIAAESCEGAKLLPGATEILRRVVAQRTPTTYAEDLYMMHGVYSDDLSQQTFFDLQPGMRLRFFHQQRQFVPDDITGQGPITHFSGYVSAGSVTVDGLGLAGPGGRPLVGVDAFLSSVRMPPVLPGSGAFSDIIDLVGALQGARHVRFCFPTRFPDGDGDGASDPTSAIAVLAAPSASAMRDATAAYYRGAPDPAVTVGYFRGRTVVQPLLPVVINDAQRHWVPAGTSARQLLDCLCPVPHIPGVVDSGAPQAMNFQRYLVSPTDITISDRYQGYSKLALETGVGTDCFGADSLDFPILGSDNFSYPGS